MKNQVLKQVIIWGAGRLGERCVKYLNDFNINVLYFVDLYPPETFKLHGYDVLQTDDFISRVKEKKIDADGIVFTTSNKESEKIISSLKLIGFQSSYYNFIDGMSKEAFYSVLKGSNFLERKIIYKQKIKELLVVIPESIASVYENLNYLYSIYFNKAYFGKHNFANQTWDTRKPYMECLFSHYIESIENDINVLEIGSWAGESAVSWANCLERSGKNGKIYCVDPWTDDHLSDLDTSVKENLNLKKACQDFRVFKLFLHNITVTNNQNKIIPVKGFSDDVLPRLNASQFDMIYVDGGHSYQQVLNDLRNSDILLKTGGLLCGDDLELQKESINEINAWRHSHLDTTIMDSKTRQRFHPGVTLAVAEFFKDKSVSCFNGFWAMKKTAAGWEKVSADKMFYALKDHAA